MSDDGDHQLCHPDLQVSAYLQYQTIIPRSSCFTDSVARVRMVVDLCYATQLILDRITYVEEPLQPSRMFFLGTST